MATKKKSRKMDPKLVAAKQQAEVSYIAKKAKATTKVVREVIRLVGRSRAKVYTELRKRGYVVKTRSNP